MDDESYFKGLRDGVALIKIYCDNMYETVKKRSENSNEDDNSLNDVIKLCEEIKKNN